MSAPTLLDVLAAEIATLDPDQLDSMADLLAPLLECVADRRARLSPHAPVSAEGWMSARDAAAHLGISLGRLQKLAAARQIPYEQDGPGCRLWFRRDQIDAWRRGETRLLEARGDICASKTFPPDRFGLDKRTGGNPKYGSERIFCGARPAGFGPATFRSGGGRSIP
jgi:hypothetical protein